MDEFYMRRALSLAERAAELDEVPVGAVIVQGDRIVGEAFNTREASKCATHHAELLAIEEACRTLGGWRLPNCKLYVTLEPCPMCTGAIINARIGRVVFAAKDARAGACGSLLNLPAYPLEAKPQCVCGILEDESKRLLRDFFAH